MLSIRTVTNRIHNDSDRSSIQRTKSIFDDYLTLKYCNFFNIPDL